MWNVRIRIRQKYGAKNVTVRIFGQKLSPVTISIVDSLPNQNIISSSLKDEIEILVLE